MAQIATSITQSKTLIDLGIDVNTADMNYCNSSYKGKDYVGEWKLSLQSPQEAKSILDMSVTSWNTYWEIIPAWSLSALIELMPIKIRNSRELTIYKGENGYSLAYYFHDEDYPIIKDGVTLLDAAFEMMKHILENKNPKSEEEQIKELTELKNELLNSIK